MSNVVVNNSITLDGVMQAPGRPDEDLRGGFEHGGWAQPYFDEVMASVAAEGIAKGGALLFGRRTYEDFASFWPDQTEDNPFAAVLNNFQKYVASTTLEEPLSWSNSTLLKGDAAEAVAELREQPGKDLVGTRQRSAGPVADAAQPRRRVRAPDPPAGSGIGPPSLPRRRSTRHSAARRHQDDHHRRGDRNLPAGPTDGGEDHLGPLCSLRGQDSNRRPLGYELASDPSRSRR
jgi:dihydrofolate reductase